MSLIQKLISPGDAQSRLKKILTENEADIARVESYRNATVSAEHQLAQLLDDWGKNPADAKIAEQALAVAREISTTRDTRKRLTEIGLGPIKAACAERTRVAIADCLRVIRRDLERELGESEKRDRVFAGESVRRVGKVADASPLSEADVAGSVRSPATDALANLLAQCDGYAGRLESMAYEQLTGVAQWVLGNR
jgi:hypothetical protein